MALPRATWTEILGAYGASAVLTVGIVALGAFIPFINANTVALVALVFLLLPVYLLRYRGVEPADCGLGLPDFLPGLRTGLLLALITLAPFLVGYHIWQTEFGGLTLNPSLENYRTFPEEMRMAPASEAPGVDLWRVQHTLFLQWRGEGRWDIGARTDGHLTYLSGPSPRRAASDPDGEWRLASDGAARLAFVVKGGDWLRLELNRDGRPVPGRNLRLGQTPQPDATDGVLDVERQIGWLLLELLVQILLVALPEEFFYRGYLQARIASRWPSRWKLGPLHTSPAILLTSALFALGHFIIGFNPQRLAVFFPSLAFGWLRDRANGGLGGAIAFHASCNLMVSWTVVHYWPQV